jgi:hypothetical protein
VPIMRDRRTLAANSINFPLQGQQFEQLPYHALVEFGINASAVTVDVAVFSGSDILQQSGPPLVKAATSPVYPDDFTLNDLALAGEKLSVQARETGAVATTVLETAVRITPL